MKLQPVELFDSGLAAPPGYNGVQAIPWGSRGLVDISRPWSTTMGDFWYACWLVDGRAIARHVSTLLVKKISPAEITKEEMAMLEQCCKESSR